MNKNFIIGVLVVLGMLSLCVDATVVFGGDDGTTTSYCTLDGKQESICNTCYGGDSGVSQSAADDRCTAQASRVCDQFPEFFSAKQAGSWLVCVSDVRDGPQGNTYKHLWVSTGDVWRYFPPYVNPDYNLFAGNGEVNCTCNLPNLNPPTSSQQSSTIYGSATSYERFNNEAVVHVGYRNVNSTWVEVQRSDSQNTLVKFSKGSGTPSFTDPTGWTRVTGSSTPGRPPVTFAPGPSAYYYGWTAHVEDVHQWYWAWLIDGVLVCLDVDGGCDGRVDIPPTPVESQLAGHCALAEHSTVAGADSIEYKFAKCAGSAKPVTWVFPGRASSSSCASTSLSGVTNVENLVNGVGGCVNFQASIASAVAITGDVKKQNNDIGVTVTFSSGHSATVRPGFNGILMNNGHCAGWRGPAYQCDVCASAGNQCNGANSGNWVDPGTCTCQPCTGNSKLTCYGYTEWDTTSCRCVACQPPTPPPCNDNAGICYYNRADPCANDFSTCNIVNCPEGVNNKAGSNNYPRRCNACETCADQKTQTCPGSVANPPTHFFSVNGDTCSCLECGVDYTPTCKADTTQNTNAMDEVGSLYYNAELNKCGCTDCSVHWQDTEFFPVTRQPDGSCSQGDHSAASGTCARCYECGTCPPGQAVVF